MSANEAFNGRILVIDDQDVIHEAFQTVLGATEREDLQLNALEAALFGDAGMALPEGLKFQLDFAHQGKEGYEKVRSALGKGFPYAMAFVDMRMPPGWNGVETIQRLWEVDRNLQVVICTAYSDYSWDEVVNALGHSDRLLLLKKPFANEEVFQLAAALTEKWSIARQLQDELELLQQTNLRLEEEIAQRRTAEAKLRQMAECDGLTKLPNRLVLTDRIEHCIRHRKRSHDRLDALLFLDLDNFKLINDGLGHNAGDCLLIQIAERLSHARRRHDLMAIPNEGVTARLGGDEFVVLLEDLRAPRDAAVVAQRLIQALRAPFDLGGKVVTIGASVGIAVIDEHAVSAEEVLRNADTAMYQAKMSGKSRFAVFDREMHAAVVARLEVETSLRTALENRELRLYYQPIVRLKDQVVTGYEALIRWFTADGRVIAPDEFIHIAEETGLIVGIGYWVIREACARLRVWNEHVAEDEGVTVSVNVSKRQLIEPHFLDEVRAILTETGVSGRFVHMEVTESAVMDDAELVVKVLEELRTLGIHIHMDDFGTGHSSLSCLHRFPIDVLKIDRSFISTMSENADYVAVIEAIITLAHNLRSSVIAEGIETLEQLNQLQRLGCDFGQGFYFSRPLPEEDLPAPLQPATMPLCAALD